MGMKYLYIISIGSLIYAYVGYYVILFLLSRIFGGRRGGPTASSNPGKISIIIAAYNEEDNIAARIANLRATLTEPQEVEIIVASDGSTDGTVALARSFPEVKVLAYPERQGKAMVHNLAVPEAKGELILFTDAESEFVPGVIDQIRARFADPKVGCVVGNLVYKDLTTGIAASEGIYMRWERRLRELESDLGLLATGTGSCLAFRKKLWRPLGRTDDSDFITPLDVVLQGYRVVLAPEAVVYDRPPATGLGEFRSRIRQTSKNFVGTLKRWGFRGWLAHPLISWALVSHKFLRWLTIYFLLGAFIANIFLFPQGLIYRIMFTGQLGFYSLGLFGLLAEQSGKKIPGLAYIYSFCVAALGMGLGVLKGLAGQAPAAFNRT